MVRKGEVDETADKMLSMSIREPNQQKSLVEVEPDEEEKALCRKLDQWVLEKRWAKN